MRLPLLDEIATSERAGENSAIGGGPAARHSFAEARSGCHAESVKDMGLIHLTGYGCGKGPSEPRATLCSSAARAKRPRTATVNDRKRQVGGMVLIVTAAVLLVLSTPCLFGGVLGLLGALADVSAAENRQMGRQFLLYAAVPLAGGVLALVVGLHALRSRRLDPMRCHVCAYSRRGLTAQAPCPECGTRPNVA